MRESAAVFDGAGAGGGGARGGDGERLLRAGDRVGAYEIEAEIGAGGFGVVYRARQEKPIAREVALKLLRREASSREAVRRFGEERQVLARMDHPSIVKVFDAGVTDEGDGYIAMELVDGVNILEHVRAEAPSLRERVRLIADASRAIHHAHQRAVVHRDVKPSNILVSEVDGRPRPRVIDFGIAKSIVEGQGAGGAHDRTQRGVLIGTPAYMSPAQLLGDPTGDVRTDVYALGVVLCEVLTGGIPRDMNTMTARLPHETPAEMPSRLADRSAGGNGDGRRVPPVAGRALRGEVDRIVLKATAWEAEQRYDSAAAMADDLERFLRGEPVLAAGPSPAYRFRKFVARHKVASVLTVVTVLALVIGLGAAFLGLSRALDAERRAARDNARSAFVSEFLLSDVISAIDPDVAQGRDITIREVLDEALAQAHERFTEDPALLLDVLDLLGDAYMKLARYADAADVFEEAVAISAGLNGAVSERTLRLRLDQALALFPSREGHADAVAMQASVRDDAIEHLGPDHLVTLRASLEALHLAGDPAARLAEARRVHDVLVERGLTGAPEYLVALGALAGAYSDTGQFERELPLRRKADALALERYGPNHSMRIVVMHALVNALQRSGLAQEAADLSEELLGRTIGAFGEVHGEVISAGYAATRAHSAAGRHARAVEIARATEGVAEQMWGAGSVAHVTARKFLGAELVAAGRAGEGLAVLEPVLEAQREQWGDESVMVADAHGLLAEAHFALGNDALAIEHADGALKKMTQGRPYFKYTALRAVCASRLGDPEGAEAVLRALYSEAHALDRGDPQGARAARAVLRDDVLPGLVEVCGRLGRPDAQELAQELAALGGQ